MRAAREGAHERGGVATLLEKSLLRRKERTQHKGTIAEGDAPQ
jgi:hypothetical protein